MRQVEDWEKAWAKLPTTSDVLSAADKEVRQLPMADIHVRPDVFQPRQFTENESESKRIVEEFVRCLDAGARLPAITVMKLGGHWVVIDGHHRLQATDEFAKLQKARLKKSGRRGKSRTHIFIRIFEGTVQQARDLAVKRNCPSKLNLTKGDKSQAAWERVAGSERYTVPKIVAITSISERMVKYMRKALAEAKKLHPEVDYSTWPWTWVVRLLHGEDPTLDDQASRDNKWVQDKARHFGKTFGNDACRKTRLFGRAIRKHDAPMSVDLGKVLLALDREAQADNDLDQRVEAAAERLQDQDTPVEAQ